MVLDSQIARSGGSRRHMASRRRRGRRWPWAVVLLIGLAFLGWVAWPQGGGEGSGEAGDADPRYAEADAASPAPTEPAGGSAQQASSGGSTADSGRTPTSSTAASDRAPTAPTEPTEPPDTTPSLTLGGEARRSASDSAAQASPQGGGTTEQRTAQQSQSRGERVGTTSQQRAQSSQASQTSQSRQAAQAEESVGPAERARAASSGASGDFQRGMELIAEGEFVEGRRILSRLLYSDRVTRSDARTIRDTLQSINRELVFSSEVAPGDPIAERYTVQPGDLLVRIARRYQVPHEFVMRINGISDARHLQAGQTIKLIKGPFDARVYLDDYRMDITVDGPDGEPLYIRSFPVGLGENDSTPPGEWVIAPGRKVVNPSWRNPRTGEFFSADDPENPIGNYWLALEGIAEDTADLTGYGIHGTIDPESIGTQASMGCIRLHDEDIERVFYMLQEGESRVRVQR